MSVNVLVGVGVTVGPVPMVLTTVAVLFVRSGSKELVEAWAVLVTAPAIATTVTVNVTVAVLPGLRSANPAVPDEQVEPLHNGH